MKSNKTPDSLELMFYRRKQRNERLSRKIYKVLHILTQNKFSISEVGLITILDVNLAPDFSNVKIYFSVLEKEPEIVEKLLNQNIPFFRSSLYKILKIKRSPNLIFLYDRQISRSIEISNLIDFANRKI